MNKHIPDTLTSQQINYKISSDYIGFIANKLNQSDIQLVKFIFSHYQIHDVMVYSHAYIAKVTGLSLRTVRRSIKRLALHGIIQSIWRPYNTCLYIINDFFKQKSVMNRIKRWFVGFMLISSFLLSRAASQDGGRLLILNDLSLRQKTASRTMAAAVYSDSLPFAAIGSLEVGPANRQVGDQEFELMISSGSDCISGSQAPTFNTLKEELAMHQFSQKELEIIATQPMEAIKRADARLKQVIAEGRPPKDPFTWFMAICRSYSPEEDQPRFTSFKNAGKQPTNQQQPYTRPSTGPQAIFKPEQRQQESDYEFAANVENVLHRRNLAGELHRNAGNYPNPKLKLLTQTEQDEIMAVHVDCSCRQTVDDSLVILTGSVRDKTVRTQPVAKRHTSWNDMVMKTTSTDQIKNDIITPVAEETPHLDEESVWEEL